MKAKLIFSRNGNFSLKKQEPVARNMNFINTTQGFKIFTFLTHRLPGKSTDSKCQGLFMNTNILIPGF